MAKKYKHDTCESVQFTGVKKIVMLLVEQPTIDSMFSKFYEYDLSGGVGIFSEESFLEIEGWITAFWQDESTRIFAGTSDGKILLISNDGGIEEHTLCERGIAAIHGISPNRVYAVATDGSAYIWEGVRWRNLGADFGRPLFAIAESPDGSLYVCGDEGLFARYSNGNWRTVELPTNSQMSALFIEGSRIWICGNKGVAFSFADENIVELNAGAANLFGFARFRNNLFLAASQEGVKIWNDGEFKAFHTNLVPFGIAANENYLAAYGGNVLAIFDGAAWQLREYD